MIFNVLISESNSWNYFSRTTMRINVVFPYGLGHRILKEKLTELNIVWQPGFTMICDWEAAEVCTCIKSISFTNFVLLLQRNSFISTFSGVNLQGCLFHMGQAIWRKVFVLL